MAFYVHVYGECIKNYATESDGHVYDGCQQFEAREDPNNLFCDVCGCHRNFHRILEVSGSSGGGDGDGAGASAAGRAPDIVMDVEPMAVNPQEPSALRTVFSEQQKLQMHQFAIRLGWFMPSTTLEEEELVQFCAEIGVTRQSFKTWMSNQRNRR